MIDTERTQVTITGTARGRCIAEPTMLFIFFEGNIHHLFALAIINTGILGFIGFIVNYLHFGNGIGRQVFSYGFRVVTEELFTINQYFGYLFTLGGYLTILIHINTG